MFTFSTIFQLLSYICSSFWQLSLLLFFFYCFVCLICWLTSTGKHFGITAVVFKFAIQINVTWLNSLSHCLSTGQHKEGHLPANKEWRRGKVRRANEARGCQATGGTVEGRVSMRGITPSWFLILALWEQSTTLKEFRKSESTTCSFEWECSVLYDWRATLRHSVAHSQARLLIENKNFVSIATVIVHMESVSSCCQDNQPTMNSPLSNAVSQWSFHKQPGQLKDNGGRGKMTEKQRLSVE